MTSHFAVLDGRLSPSSLLDLHADGGVVMSRLTAGAAECDALPSLGIKYVGAGQEIYRYQGRTYPVGAGQFLLVPALNGGEVEVRSADADAAWGLCVRLPAGGVGPSSSLKHRVDHPMLFAANVSVLGRMLTEALRGMRAGRLDRRDIALRLLDGLRNNLEPCLEGAVQALDSLTAVKASTRHEMLRRLNVARAHLHGVSNRPVELDELATVAGLSRYHLLRNFRDGFGLPPAAYHRRFRLDLALREIRAGRLGCQEAASRFGFADASSLSHAVKRVYGCSPTAWRAVSPSASPSA